MPPVYGAWMPDVVSGSHPLRPAAIACCLLGVACLCVSDALAKSLSADFAPPQLLFVRALIALAVLLVLAVPLGGIKVLQTRHVGLHFARGALSVGAASLFYLSLAELSLASATAVAFCAPLFVFLLSALLFKEPIARSAWVSLALGMFGVLLALRPTVGGTGSGALYALLAALAYAGLMISARLIKTSEPMSTLVIYIVLPQLLVSALFQPWVWRPVGTVHLPGLVGLAFFSTVGLTLITQAFRTAPPSRIAPLEYSAMIWSALLGWWIWNERPDAIFFLGAALIVLSGLMISAQGRRESVRQPEVASGE